MHDSGTHGVVRTQTSLHSFTKVMFAVELLIMLTGQVGNDCFNTVK